METVTSPAQFREALRDNCRVFDMRTMEFHSPADCIDVSIELKAGNGITLDGCGGTYTESTLLRCFNGLEPLVNFTYDRDWEPRISGLVFDAQKYEGRSLRIAYAQQALFDDLAFRNHVDGPPFSINAPTCNFNFVQLVHNREAALVHGNRIRWITGLLQSNWEADGVNRNGGVKFIAPTDHPECLRITDLHNEGCEVRIIGYKTGVLYEGGPHNAATVRFEECAGVSYDMRAASWVNSEMWLNGKAIDPMKSSFLSRMLGLV